MAPIFLKDDFVTRTLLLIVSALCALPLLAAAAALPERPAVEAGAGFIRTTQQADGGFGGFGDGQTFDAIYALRAAGLDPNTVQKGGKSPADFLKAKAPAQSAPAIAAKAALAARALGLDPRAVGGTDLVARVTAAYKADTGRYAADDFGQAVSMLGLVCTGNRALLGTKASEGLSGSQLPGGGWGFDGAADPDTTALAVQALLAAGASATDAAVTRAITYFRAAQGNDGGWGFDPDASNASSTAVVVQALLAAGEPVEGPAYRKGTKTAVTFLLGEQLPDGSFKGFDPAFGTNQVVPALAGRTFCNAVETPIAPAAPAATPTAATPTATPPAAPTRTATATPSAPATPATPTAAPSTPIAAPSPPATGSGHVGGASPGGSWVALGAVLLLAGAGAASAARRR